MFDVDPQMIQDWLEKEKEVQQPSLYTEIPFYIPPREESPPKDSEERGVWIIQM